MTDHRRDYGQFQHLAEEHQRREQQKEQERNKFPTMSAPKTADPTFTGKDFEGGKIPQAEKPPRAPGNWTITVRTLTGSTAFKVSRMSAGCWVADLKSEVEKAKGKCTVPGKEWVIIYEGKQITDDESQTLGECGLSDGSVVNLMHGTTVAQRGESSGNKCCPCCVVQ